MTSKRSIAKTIMTIILLSAVLFAVPASAETWGKSETILRGREPVVTYRAKIEGGWLIVEAKHEKGWHTYSMDNTLRAQEKSGKKRPSTELPTRIDLASGLEATGEWRQTNPKDLSTQAIKWFTWGFEGVSQFAVPVNVIGESATIVINAQACNASSCSMVEDLAIAVPAIKNKSTAVASKAPKGLIAVRKNDLLEDKTSDI